MKYSILFIIIFFPLLCFAQAGSINIYTEDGEKFFLILDGQQQNKQPQSEMRLQGLVRPNYEARIVFMNKSLSDLSGTLTTRNPKNEVSDLTYKIERDKRGVLHIHTLSAVPVKLGLNTSDMPDNSNQNASEAKFVDYTAPVRMKTTVRDDTDKNGTITTTTNVKFSLEDRSKNNKASGDCVPMDNEYFSTIRQNIFNADDEQAKMNTAMIIANSNCFTTDQVVAILKLFTFEKNRIAFAKYVYPKTLDRENYSKVTGVFEFEETKKELADFMADSRK